MRSPGLDRNFNRFWTGESLSHFAVQLGAVALPVISVELLHATEAQLGYLNAASTAAFLILGLPAGAWVDRWFKRPTMIWANLTRGAAIAMVPLLYYTDLLELWHLYLIAGVVGVATVFFDVAYQSFIPMLVGPGLISRANSRMEATAQLARLAGPRSAGCC
ncbi:MFS transporter [Tessaracoccus sp. HDW20]|nr:MFS transporter [Tessaracoccus coleopterorum]NHB84657.1 MFS transporter [Tessaracoccus coleopterorum]